MTPVKISTSAAPADALEAADEIEVAGSLTGSFVPQEQR